MPDLWQRAQSSSFVDLANGYTARKLFTSWSFWWELYAARAALNVTTVPKSPKTINHKILSAFIRYLLLEEMVGTRFSDPLGKMSSLPDYVGLDIWRLRYIKALKPCQGLFYRMGLLSLRTKQGFITTQIVNLLNVPEKQEVAGLFIIVNVSIVK